MFESGSGSIPVLMLEASTCSMSFCVGQVGFEGVPVFKMIAPKESALAPVHRTRVPDEIDGLLVLLYSESQFAVEAKAARKSIAV